MVLPLKIIILAGMPATGKSTAAKKLQEHFGFPILEKDRIKEALFDTIGFECYAEKRQLDVAANAILLRILQAMTEAGISVIVDNNFDTDSAAQLDRLIRENGLECSTVFFNGNPQVLYERYFERDFCGLRHPGHAMQTHYPPHEGESTEFSMTREGFDQRFLKLGMDSVRWAGRRMEVDATDPESVDLAEILRFLEEQTS